MLAYADSFSYLCDVKKRKQACFCTDSTAVHDHRHSRRAHGKLVNIKTIPRPLDLAMACRGPLWAGGLQSTIHPQILTFGVIQSPRRDLIKGSQSGHPSCEPFLFAPMGARSVGLVLVVLHLSEVGISLDDLLLQSLFVTAVALSEVLVRHGEDLDGEECRIE